VARFLIIYAKRYPESIVILNKSFGLMIESDQLSMSLVIYDALRSASGTPDKSPRLFNEDDYHKITDLIHGTIMACKRDDEKEWIKAVIERFDEVGFIGGNALIRAARKIKDPAFRAEVILMLRDRFSSVPELLKKLDSEASKTFADMRDWAIALHDEQEVKNAAIIAKAKEDAAERKYKRDHPTGWQKFWRIFQWIK
jgi:hypothetical protein